MGKIQVFLHTSECRGIILCADGAGRGKMLACIFPGEIKKQLFCAPMARGEVKMKKIGLLLMLALMVGTVSAVWDTFVIRENSTSGAPDILARNDVQAGAVEFGIFASNQKAGWGTDAADGYTIGDLDAISIDRLDDYTRFTVGSGPYVAPYFNIWITNGSGKFVVAANEPSNPEWAGTSEWDMTWDILKTKTVKFYEATDKSWLPSAGVGLKFQDIAGFTIQAPTAAQIASGWAGLGTGAPRELGTNLAYGFTWVFGDTLANYVSGDDGFIVANPTVVPEPATLAMLGLGALLLRKR
ncbi:MAG: PEP-CTERM sorting domain-containing protein, partial [Planctomycetales bacterium]|nr:PEP-CTERM sorting domain-containing protein [Planctomycetales bacterium]